jgi:hypothetical protein
MVVYLMKRLWTVGLMYASGLFFRL